MSILISGAIDPHWAIWLPPIISGVFMVIAALWAACYASRKWKHQKKLEGYYDTQNAIRQKHLIVLEKAYALLRYLSSGANADSILIQKKNAEGKTEHHCRLGKVEQCTEAISKWYLKESAGLYIGSELKKQMMELKGLLHSILASSPSPDEEPYIELTQNTRKSIHGFQDKLGRSIRNEKMELLGGE